MYCFINKTNFLLIVKDLQYNLLYYIAHFRFINILDTVDEIELFYKHYNEDYEFEYDYHKHKLKTYKDYLEFFYLNRTNPDKNNAPVIYKYYNNLRKICKNVCRDIRNMRYGNYTEQFIDLNYNNIKINSYDLFLYQLPLDIRTYKPGMSMPLFTLSPFHYQYNNNQHNIGTKEDKIGLYKLSDAVLPTSHDFFTKFNNTIPYNELINCDNYGEIYDKYYSDPNNLFPTRDKFIKYSTCENENFNNNHTIKDMMDDIRLENKIIIISACAVFTEELPELALIKLGSDGQQGYMKYLKYKKKYLELKKKHMATDTNNI
jgi:hypothetical protein